MKKNITIFHLKIIIFHSREKSQYIALMCCRNASMSIFFRSGEGCSFGTVTIEPRHKNTNFLHMRKQSRRSAARVISAFVCASKIVQSHNCHSNSEISGLWPFSVAVQSGLCTTWSETPKTCFLPTRLNSRP